MPEVDESRRESVMKEAAPEEEKKEETRVRKKLELES